MSKYIIDIPNVIEWGVVTCRTEGGFFTRDFDSLEELNSDYINENFGNLQDTAYQRGLDDAWEAARKIADMWTRIDNDELLAIFGITERIGYSTINSLFGKQTANVAMLNLEAYEEKQKADDKIEVGDEVEWDNDFTGDRFIVTRIYQPYGKKEQCDGIDDDGDVYRAVLIESLVKTGRHFDIQSILEDMKHD